MGKLLVREDILGHRIAEVYGHTWTEAEYELGFSHFAFRLDHGLLFCLPMCADNPWKAEDSVPAKMERIDQHLEGIHGAAVCCVLVPMDEDLFVADWVVMGLSSGIWIAGWECAPFGIWSGGIPTYDPQMTWPEHVDFWTRQPVSK